MGHAHVTHSPGRHGIFPSPQDVHSGSSVVFPIPSRGGCCCCDSVHLPWALPALGLAHTCAYFWLLPIPPCYPPGMVDTTSKRMETSPLICLWHPSCCHTVHPSSLPRAAPVSLHRRRESEHPSFPPGTSTPTRVTKHPSLPRTEGGLSGDLELSVAQSGKFWANQDEWSILPAEYNRKPPQRRWLCPFLLF